MAALAVVIKHHEDIVHQTEQQAIAVPL